ncbi:MAG: hypothetical protein FWF46_06940 [Oscillospiraceae bacterium]|nr:hypothetical protein [Oscillospiraceae bacterium]
MTRGEFHAFAVRNSLEAVQNEHHMYVFRQQKNGKKRELSFVFHSSDGKVTVLDGVIPCDNISQILVLPFDNADYLQYYFEGLTA